MRAIPLAVLLTLMIPFAAIAQPSTTPGYTAFDQQQFAKLGADVGTWNCTDAPASKAPDVVTVTQQGNWFVYRETGDDPNTTYQRWSHDRRMYVSLRISDSGDMGIITTASLDPDNATWNIVFPPGVPKNQNVTFSKSGNTLNVTFPYPDSKGNMMTGKSVCAKV